MKGVPVGGVASTSRKAGSSTSNPVEVRRSTRLSRDISSNGAPSSGSSAINSKSSRLTTKDSISRDKKRSKSGQGPSVLSDGGSDALSPRSRLSSSPPPSSPGLNGLNQLPTIDSVILDRGIQEAEDYVANCLRLFGKAVCEGCVYQSTKVIEALQALPIEQQKSWRSMIGIGKAHFEMLNYDKVSYQIWS